MNTVFFYIIFAIEMTNLLDKPSEHHTEFHAPAVEKYLTNECYGCGPTVHRSKLPYDGFQCFEGLLYDFYFPAHFESGIDFIQHLLFVFSTAVGEDIKPWCCFTLCMTILFVFGGRDDIDSTEPNIQFSHPHQSCFYNGCSKSGGCIMLLEY